jgi:hypothetical protein
MHTVAPVEQQVNRYSFGRVTKPLIDGSSILDVYNTSFFSNTVCTGYSYPIYELRYCESAISAFTETQYCI